MAGATGFQTLGRQNAKVRYQLGFCLKEERSQFLARSTSNIRSTFSFHGQQICPNLEVEAAKDAADTAEEEAQQAFAELFLAAGLYTARFPGRLL